MALNQKELPIKNPCYDLSDYDTLILGVPSWANYPAPYYRTFIKKAENFDIKTIGVFITGGRAIKTNEKTMEVFKNEQ